MNEILIFVNIGTVKLIRNGLYSMIGPIYICFFYKIEPKRKETKKIVKVSCFNFAGIQQSILLILSSLDPHFQALTDSVISLGYSPLNTLPFPYSTV